MSLRKFPLIVFCGMDGSGKTTLSRKVAEHLRKKGISTEWEHGHGYTVSQNSFGTGEDTLRRFRHIFRLGLPLAMSDNLITFYFRYQPVLKVQGLVCDRYFYDKVARLMFYGICNESLASLYLKILPKPDLLFFLDISAEQAHQRKEEYSLSECTAFRRYYRYIAHLLDAPLIDTSKPLEQSWKEILTILERKSNLQVRPD